MATLGNVPAEAYTNTVKDSFSGNGSATAFTMSLPTVTNDVRVVVENVIQDPTVAYSVSGTTLTFTSAPPSGTNNIYVVHLGPAVMTTVPPAEIADATTFASSLTVQGAFTSKGIDDNADAVAMTIDSNENIGIGTSNPSKKFVVSEGGAHGFEISPYDGSQNATRLLNYNRSTNAYFPLEIEASQIAFETNGSEKMRIDSSGKLLVGKSTSNYATEGVEIRPNEVLITKAGANPLSVRNNGDGGLISLNSAGVSVGSIGTVGGDAYFGTGDTGIIAYDNGNAILPFNTATGAYADNSLDFGVATQRFKNAYLSGGVYLGGTGSANLLDSYEEGTFTPTNNGTVGVAVSTGKYTKVGEVVHFHIYFQWNSNTSMTTGFSGLPFTVKGAGSPENTYYTMCSTWNNQGVTYPSGRTTLLGYPVPNTTTVDYSCVGSNVASGSPTFAGSGQLYMTGHYYTAS